MQSVGRFLLYYVVWMLSAALATFAAFWLWTDILFLVALLLTNPWYWNLIRIVITMILGLLWIIFVIGAEGYFRKWLKDDWQPWTVLKVFGILVAVSLVAYGVNVIFL